MELRFKTNINCGGCVAAITPKLNAAAGIQDWKVDTQNPNKVLTVHSDELRANEVCELVQQAGFNAEPLVQ